MSEESEQRVSIEVKDGVAQVRLNRADKLNALDAPMFNGLLEAAKKIEADKSVRVVVLAGEGRSFCAGLDFPSIMSMDPEDPDADLLAKVDGMPANRAQSAAYVWTALPVPVIAAINGHCFGGGIQIALAADVRFIHPEAEMSIMEMKWGLIPDMTGTQTIRHILPMDVAKELTFTGRRISGAEAVELGLATHCVDDPIAAATELATEIASKSPHAMRAAKKLLTRAYTAEPVEGLKLEEGIQRTLLKTPNQTEAVISNMQKRTPDFKDVE